jgi:hypothetical protein
MSEPILKFSKRRLQHNKEQKQNKNKEINKENKCSKGGRKDGAVNYNRQVLLDVIESILPQGANEWKTVAIRYQDLSKEVNLRAGDQIKKYFNKDLCKDGKKPTGKSGPPKFYDRAMEL